MERTVNHMENLIFSLNATVPIFLLMLLGLFFRKIGWIDEVFASKMNKFVFLVPLPVLLFEDLATVDFSAVWDLKFVLFCFCATFLSIGIAAAVSSVLEGPVRPGRVHPGGLSEQRSAPRHCLYPEYIRRCRHGAAYDHRECTPL